MTIFFNQICDINMIQLIDEATLNNYICSGGIIVRTYPKNHMIRLQFDPCTSFDFVLEGKLTINRYDLEGNILNITHFGKGESLGGNLLFSNHPIYPFNILALEETQILHITRSTMIELLEHNRPFLLAFLNDLSDKTQKLTTIIDTLSEKTLRQKMTQFIEREVELQHSKTIRLPVTKKLLAERFGVARTSLSRELKMMQDEGLVEVQQQFITLLK